MIGKNICLQGSGLAAILSFSRSRRSFQRWDENFVTKYRASLVLWAGAGIDLSDWKISFSFSSLLILDIGGEPMIGDIKADKPPHDVCEIDRHFFPPGPDVGGSFN